MGYERRMKRMRHSIISLVRKEVQDSPILRTESTARVDCESYFEEFVGSAHEHEQVRLIRAGRTDTSTGSRGGV